MLHDAWLLSDLDGTLISTPHKARGQYLTLAQSPCVKALRRWLLNGGNVCIITTADTRVLQQVYAPLRSILRDGSNNNNNNNNNSNNNNNNKCGELLLSLYTGAVLYRCTASGVEVVREYAEATHCATAEAVEVAKRYGLQFKESAITKVSPNGRRTSLTVAYVEGTCFSMKTCRQLLQRVEDIFLEVVKGILKKDREVVDAFTGMSARYKEMWRLLLHYLDMQYREYHRTAAVIVDDTSAGKRNSTGILIDSVEWKCRFLQQRRRFLRVVGILRVEVVQSRPMISNIEREHSVNRKAEEIKSSVLRILGDKTNASSLFAEQMIHLLGTELYEDDDDYDNDSNTTNTPNNNISTNTNINIGDGDKDNGRKNGKEVSKGSCVVAQVMVLGIPMRLYPRFFKPHLESFANLGVTAIPQPNSVVFSKMGVCKSTIIRYLIKQPYYYHHHHNHSHNQHKQQKQQQKQQQQEQEQEQEKKEHHPNNNNKQKMFIQRGNCCTPRGTRVPRFCGAVDITRAVALGDNPHSTDFELTVFPQLPFISVEMHGQRCRRHAHIDAIPRKGETQQRRGPMMDDRRLDNLYYIGGEENGTAVFLDFLMNVLHVPPLSSLNDVSPLKNGLPATFGAAVAQAIDMSRTALCDIPSRM